MRKTSAGLFALASLVLAGLGGQPAAVAQESGGARPVTILVPYPAGGLIDVVARNLADGLREKLNQPTVVLNKPGANGKVALGELIRMEPDGKTILVNNEGGISIPPAVDTNFRFDYTKDYTPIAQAAETKWIVTVRSDLPARDMKTLIAYAKSRPGELNFGSPGLGTTPHLATEVLMQQTGVKMVHVPYAGAAPATTDLIGGRLDVLVSSVPAAKAYFGTDKMRVLAVLSDKRIPELPEVPTAAEAGIEPIVVGGWVGVFGPPGLSKEIVESLSAGIREVMADPKQGERLRALGAEPSFMGPPAFGEFYQAEVRKWKAFATERGIKVGN